MNINFNDYRSPKDGRLMTKKLKTDGIYDILSSMYPFYDKLSDMVYCYEHGIDCKRCPECGKIIRPKVHACKQCSAQKMGSRNVKFAAKANKGKPSPFKGKTYDERGMVHTKYKDPEKWEQVKHKISEANSGENNGMYRHTHTKEQRLSQSNEVKARIESGDFTPKSNNRQTHFDSSCNGKKYRSSWEAAFASTDDSLEYETLRIPYVSNSGVNRIYIVDFVSEERKEIYEVRPDELFDDEDPKFVYAKEWCNRNGYKFVHIGISHILNIQDKIKYDLLDENTIRKLNNAIDRERRNRKTKCNSQPSYGTQS